MWLRRQRRILQAQIIVTVMSIGMELAQVKKMMLPHHRREAAATAAAAAAAAAAVIVIIIVVVAVVVVIVVAIALLTHSIGSRRCKSKSRWDPQVQPESKEGINVSYKCWLYHYGTQECG